LQKNNDSPNNNNSSKDASDEILDILNNYRKAHSEPEQISIEKPANEQISDNQKQAANIRRQPDNNANTIIIGNSSRSKNTYDAPVETYEDTDRVMSHFADEEQYEQEDGGIINSHFSDSADKKVLTKAQKSSKEARLQKEKKPKKFFSALGKSSLLFKALFYILLVVIISAYLSYYIITIGNDVFALVKDDQETKIVLSQNATTDEVVNLLTEKKVIDYPWVFKLYLKYRSDKEFEFIPGEHKLNSTMNYTQIIQELTTLYTERKQVRVVIPEGYTVDQIIDLLVKSGVGSRDKYVDAINNYDYKHEFVQELKKLELSPNRKYRLEGYLFPDTYDFYTDTEEYLVINKLLNNFDVKFWADYKTQYEEVCKSHKMNFDQLIILASMVQAEGNNAVDFEYMSYVFHNRLKNSTKYPKLESDATIQYILNERREDLTEADLKIDNPYNTYEKEGLPPGSICNPGLDAISAALFPVKPVDDNGKEVNAFYFVSNKAGKTYYAEKNDQHATNKKKVERENAALTNSN
jgi:UPF0755 protein